MNSAAVFARNFHSLRGLLVLLALLVMGVGCGEKVDESEGEKEASPKATSSPLVIGESIALKSDILGETRTINVYLPDAYSWEGDRTLPVLYMPDGGIHEDFLHLAGLVHIGSLNGTMRPHILVGIENTERRRDLTGPTENPEDREIAPETGGSEKFRAFLREELIPFIDSRYRTSGERAIIGESLAGLFVVETMLREPELFDTGIAIDPSLWWDNERLVQEAVTMLAGYEGLPRRLHLATSEQIGIKEPTARLADALESASTGVEVSFSSFLDETHMSIFNPAALEGLRLVFAP